jgi:hypothetical protein
MTTGSDWYSQRQFDHYPLLPTATAVADDGKSLPTGFIRDVSLRFTGLPNDVAFIRELTVTTQAITVVVGCGSAVLAACTVLRSSLVGSVRVVPLSEVSPGTIGRLAMADVSDEPPGRWLFSSAEQTGLSPLLAMPTISPSTDGRLSRDGFVPLTGPRVFVAGDIDVEVLSANRLLDGVVREALVVRLNTAAVTRRSDDNSAGGSPAVYQVGCGARPESKTCQQDAIETINRVPPDCCGRIYVELQGCGTLSSVNNGHGAQLDCDIAPDDLCPPTKLPDQDGRLPTDAVRLAAECDTTTGLDSQDL